MLAIDDFKKIELRVAKVLAAERVEGSEKLIKLKVSLGENHSTGSISSPQTNSEQEERQIVAGIGKAYEPEALIGREIIIVANLEPRVLMGLESQGMLLAAVDESGAPVLLMPEREVPPGSGVR